MDNDTNALKYFYELHKEEFEAFKKQDPVAGKLDIAFDIDGMKLYAHKFKLTTISTTFKSMLSENWTTPNGIVVIKDFSFYDFREFIAFLYSGECDLNIFAMVDMAEFYDVKAFKKACEDYLKVFLSAENFCQVAEIAEKYSMVKLKQHVEEFLCKTEKKMDIIYQVLEVAYQYSMEDLKKNVHDFISKNLMLFIQAEQFQSLAVNVMKDVVEANQNTSKSEQLFEMVYKWAEKRALEQQENCANFNDAIKKELNDFLPLFKFQIMSSEFLIKSVVTKSFLFTGAELSNYLWNARYPVSIVDESGKMMNGVLNCPDIDKIYNVIKSQKNVTVYSYWSLNHTRPTTPYTLVKNEQIEYYLIYDIGGDLAVKRPNELLDGHYLLAEMFAEVGFQRENMKFI